ncbi:MAG: MmcQ/YjbR family DNA-binding protein [Planctomycetota bacterium JB042]
MGARGNDPTEAIREKASRYPGVDEGTACTQSSFKAGGKGFLYVGEQGGRFKAMFKLDRSIPEATALAEAHPDDVQVGKGGWVTARFSAEKPMPKGRWTKWLDESYALAAGAPAKPRPVKKGPRRKKS